MNANTNTNANENTNYENDEIDTFVTLNEYPAYEIDSQYPYDIRKKGQYGFIREGVDTGGYIIVSLYQEKCYKHRVIAQQFLPNPERLPCVDHKNHNRSDNHLSNLRWVSYKENNTNVVSKKGIKYEFRGQFEANALQINFVNGSEYEGYWLDGHEILFFDGVCYRILFKKEHGNQWRVSMKDVEGNSRNISKRQLDRTLSEEYGLKFDI